MYINNVYLLKLKCIFIYIISLFVHVKTLLCVSSQLLLKPVAQCCERRATASLARL